MGERAILAETASLDDARALHRALAASRPEGVVDLVPAARTVLVVVDPRRLSVAAARSWVQHAPPVPASAAESVAVDLDVVYDGPDLDETAAALGIDAADLVRRHAAAVWTVAFTGFAPGFGYLVSPAWPFDVPRRASPRTRVPAGAVGLAGGFSGAYPRPTPGGWRLIGMTDAALFDPTRSAPALLVPGATVRFRPTRATVRASGARSGARSGAAPTGAAPTGAASIGAAVTGAAPTGAASTGAPPTGAASTGAASTGAPPTGAAVPRPSSAPARGTRRLDQAPPPSGGRGGFGVIASGLLATAQDLGRPGAAALGVARSGALDRAALGTANRLVGNPEGAAGVETTLGGFEAVARRDLWVAVTGAWCPVQIGGHTVDPGAAHPWPRATRLRIGAPDSGIRSYLAVRGGVRSPAVLGSSSTDTMAGLGPAPLAPGDEIDVGDDPSDAVPPSDLAPWSAPGADVDIAVAPGPRPAWAVDPQQLFDGVWTVGPADRVGMRLDGAPLARARDDELASEGMVPGAIQLPPDGRPVILLADGPVTGGYPVIAVVVDASLDLLAQAGRGTRLRFRHAHPRL